MRAGGLHLAKQVGTPTNSSLLYELVHTSSACKSTIDLCTDCDQPPGCRSQRSASEPLTTGGGGLMTSPAHSSQRPRVVSLLPSATEILALLGAKIVGRSHECDWPPAVRSAPALTGAYNQFVDSRQMHDAVSSCASQPRSDACACPTCPPLGSSSVFRVLVARGTSTVHPSCHRSPAKAAGLTRMSACASDTPSC